MRAESPGRSGARLIEPNDLLGAAYLKSGNREDALAQLQIIKSLRPGFEGELSKVLSTEPFSRAAFSRVRVYAVNLSGAQLIMDTSPEKTTEALAAATRAHNYNCFVRDWWIAMCPPPARQKARNSNFQPRIPTGRKFDAKIKDFFLRVGNSFKFLLTTHLVLRLG